MLSHQNTEEAAHRAPNSCWLEQSCRDAVVLTSCWAVASLALMGGEKGPWHQHKGPREQGQAPGSTRRCSISAGCVWSTQQEPVWLLPSPAGVHWPQQPLSASSTHPLGVTISSVTQLKSLDKLLNPLDKMTSINREIQGLKQHRLQPHVGLRPETSQALLHLDTHLCSES